MAHQGSGAYIKLRIMTFLEKKNETMQQHATVIYCVERLLSHTLVETTVFQHRLLSRRCWTSVDLTGPVCHGFQRGTFVCASRENELSFCKMKTHLDPVRLVIVCYTYSNKMGCFSNYHLKVKVAVQSLKLGVELCEKGNSEEWHSNQISRDFGGIVVSFHSWMGVCMSGHTQPR